MVAAAAARDPGGATALRQMNNKRDPLQSFTDKSAPALVPPRRRVGGADGGPTQLPDIRCGDGHPRATVACRWR